jgi:hypothetical protein
MVINGMYCLPCFALSVLLVATTKVHFEEQALVLGAKQSSQAYMADRASKSGRLARLSVRPACFVWGMLVLFYAYC